MRECEDRRQACALAAKIVDREQLFTWGICPMSRAGPDSHIKDQTLNGVIYLFMDVGAADKAAIQLVKVQPYQLLVSDT